MIRQNFGVGAEPLLTCPILFLVIFDWWETWVKLVWYFFFHMNCHFLSILILIQVRIRFWVCLDSYQIRIRRLKIRENIWWARYFSQKSCGSFRCGSQWGSWLQRVCDGTGPIQVWIFSLNLILDLILDLNFTKYLRKKMWKRNGQ